MTQGVTKETKVLLQLMTCSSCVDYLMPELAGALSASKIAYCDVICMEDVCLAFEENVGLLSRDWPL